MINSNDPVVDILLATYNGGQYLHEQLISVQQQQFTNWRLLIHDDGSHDNTLNIIEQFVQRDPRIVWLQDNIQGLGPAGNFLHLLKHSKANYIAFADQDDYWQPKKLARQLAFIREKEKQQNGQAMAVYCNAHYWKDGKVVKKQVNILHPQQLSQQLFLNGGIVGCSIVFNRALLDRLLPLPTRVAMHDHFIVTAALVWGHIYYQDTDLFLYRQHGQNATGMQEYRFIDKMKGQLFSGRPLVDRQHFEAHRLFYAHYLSTMPEKAVTLFKAYFEIVQTRNLWKRIKLIGKHHFQLAHKKYILYLKTILRKTINS